MPQLRLGGARVQLLGALSVRTIPVYQLQRSPWSSVSPGSVSGPVIPELAVRVVQHSSIRHSAGSWDSLGFQCALAKVKQAQHLLPGESSKLDLAVTYPNFQNFASPCANHRE